MTVRNSRAGVDVVKMESIVIPVIVTARDLEANTVKKILTTVRTWFVRTALFVLTESLDMCVTVPLDL